MRYYHRDPQELNKQRTLWISAARVVIAVHSKPLICNGGPLGDDFRARQSGQREKFRSFIFNKFPTLD
jgi:hypothetical protein